jgi:hypothetical protein
VVSCRDFRRGLRRNLCCGLCTGPVAQRSAAHRPRGSTPYGPPAPWLSALRLIGCPMAAPWLNALRLNGIFAQHPAAQWQPRGSTPCGPPARGSKPYSSMASP